MARLRKAWAAEDQGRHGDRLRRVADSRARRRRRLQGRWSKIAAAWGWTALQKQTDDLVAQAAAERARPDQRRHAVPLEHAAALPGHRPTRPRRWAFARRREPDARHVSRLAVRQQLQRLRPPLAGHRPGRGRVPQSIEDINLFQGPQQPGADGAAGHAGRRCARSAARSRSRATTSTPPRRSTATSQPGFSTGRRHRRRSTRGCRRIAAALDEDRVDRADVHANPGGQHGDVRLRAGGHLRLPGAGGAVRKLVAAAGGDPGRAAVPALFVVGVLFTGIATSTSSCRSAWSCWSAWPARTRS